MCTNTIHTVIRCGQAVYVRKAPTWEYCERKEFDIFYYLFQKKGDVVSHKELYEKVWKREYIHDDTNIMAHIHRLRGKVEKDPKNPRYICNQYGIGYYFGSVFKEAFSTI